MNQGEFLERALRELGADFIDGIATSGDASTITDTALINLHSENRFKNWTAFITLTTDGLAPIHQYSMISTFVASTGVIGLATALSAAVGGGDLYSIMRPTPWNLSMIRKLGNDALRQFEVPRVDTTLSIATDTRSYTLPIATKGKRPFHIDLQDDDGGLHPVTDYDVQPAAGGSSDSLVFRSQYPDGWTINYWYLGQHPDLTLYSDYVNERVHDDLAVAALVEAALRWRVRKTGARKESINEMHDFAKDELIRQKAMHPIEMPTQKQNFLQLARMQPLKSMRRPWH